MTSDPTHGRRRGLVAGGVVAAALLAVAAVSAGLGRATEDGEVG